MSPWFTCDPGVAALSPGPQLLQRLQFCLSQAPFASSAEAQGARERYPCCRGYSSEHVLTHLRAPCPSTHCRPAFPAATVPEAEQLCQ